MKYAVRTPMKVLAIVNTVYLIFFGLELFLYDHLSSKHSQSLLIGPNDRCLVLLLIALGALLILFPLVVLVSWTRIDFTEHIVIVRKTLRKAKVIQFSDISCVTLHENRTNLTFPKLVVSQVSILCSDGFRFHISSAQTNFDQFICFLDQTYSKSEWKVAT